MTLLMPNAQTIMPGRCGAWPFVEPVAVTGTVLGAHGAGDAALSGNATFGAGGFALDGSADYATAGGNGCAAGKSAVSVLCWLYVGSLAVTQAAYYESIEGAVTNRFSLGVTSSGEVRLAGRDSDTGSFTVFAISAALVTASQWVHLAAVYNAPSSHKVFLNGVDVTDSAASGTGTFDAGGSQNVWIGRTPTTYTTGAVADLLTFGRALAASEIAVHHSRTRR